MDEKEKLRKTGIELIGDAPWGTHFCQFYHTGEDLIDILVPYFKAGLENNEFCMWITSEPLEVEDARTALREAVDDLDSYIKKGQIEIIPYTEWYLKDGVFDLQRVLNSWIDKLDKALSKGCDGMRVTGNTAWLEKKDWKSFTDYEEQINAVIGKYQMLAICTYSLDKCGAGEVVDVVANHQFAMIKREGEWVIIESSERKKAEDEIKNLAKFPEENVNPVYRASKDGVLLYANSAARRVILEDQTKIGDKIPENWIGMIKNAYDSGKGQQIEISLSGRVFLFDLVPVIESGYVNLYAIDVTERKRMEENIRSFQIAIDGATDAIGMATPEGKHYYQNEAFDRLFGLTVEDVEGAAGPPSTVYADEKVGREVFETILRGGTWTGEVKMKSADGSEKDIFLRAYAIKDEKGKVVGIVGVHTDITERKKTEEELKKKVHGLEVFHKAAVDRELKMKQLEARIKELEQKPGEKA